MKKAFLIGSVFDDGSVEIRANGEFVMGVKEAGVPDKLKRMNELPTEEISECVAEFSEKLYRDALVVLKSMGDQYEVVAKLLEEDPLAEIYFRYSLLDSFCMQQYGTAVGMVSCLPDKEEE